MKNLVNKENNIINMTVLQVITVAYNRPDFIALQYNSLCKYIKGPWVYRVFSDAEVDNNDNDHKIKNICKKLHVQHIRIPPYIQSVPGPSPRAGNALDWALKNYAYNYDGLTLVMDSDIFLAKSFDPISFMACSRNPGQFYDMAGVVQTMSYSGYWFRYLWMALMVINGKTIKHKNPEQIRFMNAVPVENFPTDAGGPMHYYLENHPDLMIKPLKHLWSGSWTLQDIIELGYNIEDPFCQYMKKEKADNEIAGIGEMISDYFYHYRAGSNWNQLSPEVVIRRAINLNEYMLSIPKQLDGWCLWSDIDDSQIRVFTKQGQAIYDYSLGDVAMQKIHVNDYVNRYSLRDKTNYNLIELFLIHELVEEDAILSLEFYDDKENSCYDSDLVNLRIMDKLPNYYLHYTRSGMPKKIGETKIYSVDPELLCDVLTLAGEKWVAPAGTKFGLYKSRPQITTSMTGFSIKKQHHYQIIIIGQKLDPDVSIQLVCDGDTFFGALDAKEFSLASDMTLIKWDFYNKFETKISIGLKVTDNRTLKKNEIDSTYTIRRAYLSCIGPLG